MKLFELFAELSLDSSKFNRGVETATKQGSTMANKLSNGFQAVSAKTIAMGHALYDAGKFAAKMVFEVGKAAVTGYAQTEQLMDGVKTMFGTSAETVIRNAQLAYKNAGMDANAYMETVTSFSASLLKSLGGDTVAAANYADMAVQDMADNANKFGSDMASIQNAYQGFAKQNYTMLDNLKLGYGGTKTEMQRLLKDAQKIQRAQGKNVRYSINNLSDVYEAIHVIQTEMGITGTTAEEAAKTISGSFYAFKASWSNLLAGLGTDQEMDELVDSLLETGANLVTNVLNIIPKMAKRVLKGVDSFLSRYEWYNTLKAAFEKEGWAGVADAAVAAVGNAFAAGWNANASTIATNGVNAMITAINDALGTDIPTVQIDLPKWEDIEQAVTTWWEGVKGSIESAASWTLKIFDNPTEAADDIKQAISEWWTGTAKPAIESFCTWALSAPDMPPESQDPTFQQNVATWWETFGANLGSLCTFAASLSGVEDGTAEGIGKEVEDWWKLHGAGLSNITKLIVSLGTPDETDTDAAAGDLKKWFTQDLLPKMTDTLMIPVKPVLEGAEDFVNTMMEGIVGMIKDGLNAIGLGWLVKDLEAPTVSPNEEGGWKSVIENKSDEWFGLSDEGEKGASADLTGAVEALAAAASAASGNAAAGAASALNGAKVEMDGATVGQLIVPYAAPLMSEFMVRQYNRATLVTP